MQENDAARFHSGAPEILRGQRVAHVAEELSKYSHFRCWTQKILGVNIYKSVGMEREREREERTGYLHPI